MKIVVLETSTVFEGEETIYRYDLTADGIAAGGATAKAVVEQTNELMADNWPPAAVSIDAPPNAMAALTAAFAGVGVLVQSDVETPRPVRSANPHRLNIPSPEESERPKWFLPALGLVVCCVAVACWWGLQTEPPSGGNVHTSTSAQPSAHVVAQTPETIPGVEYAHEALRVRLPEGFQLAPREDGALTATGPDAELRILLAADPVYGVPPDAVYREVELMIEHDPTLSAQQGSGFRDHAVRTIDYREDPGDGSQVHWVTWVEADHQFSMGCHTRSEPTIPQLAACRMAAGTLQLQLDRGNPQGEGTEIDTAGV